MEEKKMKRKTLLFLSLLVVASMVLAACQPPAEPTEEPTEEVEEPEEEVEEPEEEVVEPEEEEVVEPEEEAVVRVEGKGGWLDEIVYSVVDLNSAITQIGAGAVDMYSSGMSSDLLPEIEAAELPYAESGGLYYELTFNPIGPIWEESTGKVNPFSEARAREAMNWLVDRDYINREVYNGGALPKWWSIITNMPDYTSFASTVRALETEYAYDMARADAQIEEVMLEIPGVTREDGMYMFEGEQVEILMLIRNDSDKTRIPIGDYVANQLEEIGFATVRDYKTSSEASPIWILGNPADGLFHIYTGAWGAGGIDRNEGDNFQFFDTPASAYGFTALWQGFGPAMDNEDRYLELADDLANNNFNSIEERAVAMEEMLELALKESIHVWLIDGRNFVPHADNVQTGFDLMAGVDNSQIYPYTVRFTDQVGGTMNISQSDIYVDPWNPLAGSNWTYDHTIQRAVEEWPFMLDPYTGLVLPLWFETAEITAQEGLPIGKTHDYLTLDFAPEVVVPEDAIMDWDAVNGQFITAAEKLVLDAEAAAQAVVDAQAAFDAAPAAVEEAQTALDAAQAALDDLADDASDEDKAAAQLAVDDATAALDAAQAALDGGPDAIAAAEEAAAAAAAKEKFTARIKSVVTYPDDFWGKIKWHDGSELTLADMLYWWILPLDAGKEGSPNYDESQAASVAADLAAFKGMKIVSEDPLVIEAYSDYYETDAELCIVEFLSPAGDYGILPWHVMAPATLADAAGEVAFSADKAEALSTDTTTVEWLNLIGGESLGIVEKYLDQALADTFIPYPNVLGDLISAEDATARYENLKAFYAERGHFWAGNGPYILDDVFLTEQVATVVYNPMYPYDSDRWAAFAAPKLAEVEVEGEGSVVLGTDFVFDVTVTFEGEAYPDADITRVFGLVYDGTGALVAEVDAELVEDGMYTVTVPADVSAEMEAGASKVEVVVVPTVVATPTFVAFEFVAVE
jgi:hypothetical protein